MKNVEDKPIQEGWRCIHEALGCPGCKFCDDESLYRDACCTHILGPVVNGTGRCDRRKENHEQS